MKLNQLKALIALADGHGIAGAAEQLHVSKPAITKTIANIEDELGVKLFDRSKYRLQPNKYTEKLLIRARAICAEHEQALRDIESLKEHDQHIVRLSGSPGTLPVLIPKALQLAHHQKPGLMLDFVGDANAPFSQKFKELREGKFDLLISAIDESIDLSELHFESLMTIQVSIIASKNHPIRQLSRPTLKDVSGYHCLAPHSLSENSLTRKAFYRAGAHFPQLFTVLPMREMIATMLHHGEYIAFLPLHSALIDSDLIVFDAIDVAEELPAWPLYLIRRKLSEPSAAQHLFVDMLKELIN
ncbi:MAG: LysR family transcriptional regulator [Gammaproteobacteria bacterium]|nr:LysR family transcriptional regulator [Gammaproteobacteria bacterium]